MQDVKKHHKLPLPIEHGHFYLIDDELKKNKEELEIFLDGIHHMNSRDFSKKVLFGQEIKSNNTIEGYLDDINLVNDIIRHPNNNLDEQQKRRILNMYRGYKYILQNEDINKDSIKELYSILSNKLLEQYDLDNMGEYYRNKPVYIYYSSSINAIPDQGVNSEELEEKMNILLDYINSKQNLSCITDHFIKSQIFHVYFVYLHPYFDINGRTSRTIAMWYLLNNGAYPYIIFNRAIQLNKSWYYKVIREGRKFHNLTFFLNYMLKNVLIELEKEYTIEVISDKASYELNDSDIQALYYIYYQ